MTPLEVIKNTENLLNNQNTDSTITVDPELCKKIKSQIEEKHAILTLRKDILPVTRWYLEDVLLSKKIVLDIGDTLEYIDLEQSFDFKNNYKGSVRAIVVDLDPKHLKLATPQKSFYLMGENTKILAHFKPLIQNQINPLAELTESLKAQNNAKLTYVQIRNLIILITSIISILIFGTIMLLSN